MPTDLQTLLLNLTGFSKPHPHQEDEEEEEEEIQHGAPRHPNFPHPPLSWNAREGVGGGDREMTKFLKRTEAMEELHSEVRKREEVVPAPTRLVRGAVGSRSHISRLVAPIRDAGSVRFLAQETFKLLGSGQVLVGLLLVYGVASVFAFSSSVLLSSALVLAFSSCYKEIIDSS